MKNNPGLICRGQGKRRTQARGGMRKKSQSRLLEDTRKKGYGGKFEGVSILSPKEKKSLGDNS